MYYNCPLGWQTVVINDRNRDSKMNNLTCRNFSQSKTATTWNIDQVVAHAAFLIDDAAYDLSAEGRIFKMMSSKE